MLTRRETARIAVETYYEHAARCRDCRKLCTCDACRAQSRSVCPRAREISEIAAELVAGAMTR